MVDELYLHVSQTPDKYMLHHDSGITVTLHSVDFLSTSILLSKKLPKKIAGRMCVLHHTLPTHICVVHRVYANIYRTYAQDLCEVCA
jgi:hypothetical protein